MIRSMRRDAPFWAGVLIGIFGLASLGCIGVAAAQKAPPEAEILTTDNVPPPADL